jgi:cytochrome c peroxidase
MFPVLLLALVIPLGLDLFLPVPDNNLMTAERIELGRRLFRDPRLSRDSTVSCTTCHDPARAFATDEPIAVGVFGRVGRRNAPALINRGYGRAFFWDARSATLEQQVLRPIEDPNEMDLSVSEAAARTAVPVSEMSRALASYVRSILSGNSRYDRFADGDATALTAAEQRGLEIFRGNGRCTSCHIGPNFSDERLHNTGVAWKADDRGSAGAFRDEGGAAVTGHDEDRGAFKTPTLREIARTAPYMHDGSFATLDAVINFYSDGARPNPNLDPQIRPLHLAPAEKRDLASFLRALGGSVTEGGHALADRAP